MKGESLDDGAVTAGKLGPKAVKGENLDDGTVTTEKLGPKAVKSTAKPTLTVVEMPPRAPMNQRPMRLSAMLCARVSDHSKVAV